MIAAIVLVWKFQINRPKVIHSYRTSNPWDNRRGGTAYTCGYSLPPQLQGPDALANESSVNRCYESSALETVDILMYPNSSAAMTIEQILRYSYPSLDDFKKEWTPTTISGFKVSEQGHYISWRNDSLLSNFPKFSLQSKKEWQRVISIDYIQNGEFLEFPSSYLKVAFVFKCTNCTLCPLSSVQRIFESLESLDQPWGDCKPWAPQTGNGDHCANKEHSYEAKCVLYAKAGIPLNFAFALQTFLRKLQELPGIDTITPPQDASPTALNKVSFNAKELYMNFSRVSTEQQIRLNFFELSRRSSAWSALLQLYPTLDNECSELVDVKICTGTSVCVLFKSAERDGYAVLCSEMHNTSKCQDDLLVNDPSSKVRVDDDDNLWEEFGVQRKNWSDLMCMEYSCRTTPSYTVLWETAPAKEHDALNSLLRSKIHLNERSQQSGVCTKRYKNVIRQTLDNTTVFMLTKCSQNSTATQPAGYCWLTGEFHNLNDTPKDKLRILNVSTSAKLFVCYHVGNQNRYLWLLIFFGILFGWLGSVDLLFNWIHAGVVRPFEAIRSWITRGT